MENSSEKPSNSLKKVTLFSKFIALFMFVVFTLGGFYVGFLYGSYGSSDKAVELQKKLSEQEEEIELLIRDSGKITNTFESTYNFADIGIYSPLFENKKVKTTTFLYKRNTTHEKQIEIEDDKFVTVWQFASAKGGDMPTGSSNKNVYAFFGGYENYNQSPIFLTDLQKQWKESYTNKNGIKMFWGSNNQKWSIGVLLEFNMINTPNGYPILVQLAQKIPLDNRGDGVLIVEGKEKLKKLADTISLTPK